MKAFGRKTLREKVKYETEKYLHENHQELTYEIMRGAAPYMMRQAVALTLYALTKMGFGVKRLGDVYDRIVDAETMPAEMLGNKVRIEDVERLLEDKYHIDLDRLKINLPPYDEWKKENGDASP